MIVMIKLNLCTFQLFKKTFKMKRPEKSCNNCNQTKNQCVFKKKQKVRVKNNFNLLMNNNLIHYVSQLSFGLFHFNETGTRAKFRIKNANG